MEVDQSPSWSTRVTLGRLLLSLAMAVAAVIATGSAAEARCIGPTLVVAPEPVDPGREISVDGRGFGDACHDTGLPMDAHGVLGEPLSDLQVQIVQGGNAQVIADVTADDDYAFQVSIVAPAWLQPGKAQLKVTRGGVQPEQPVAEGTLTITDAPAQSAGDDTTSADEIAAPQLDADPRSQGSESSGRSPLVFLALGAGLIALTAFATWRFGSGRARS